MNKPTAPLATFAALLVAVLGACRNESGTMKPGENCVACHSDFTAAGTVYTTPGGAAGVEGAEVTITSTTSSQSVTLTTNSVGNFYTQAPLSPPLAIDIAYAGTVVSMTAAPDGACNRCHGGDQRVHVP
jgi:hypothetical protein